MKNVPWPALAKALTALLVVHLLGLGPAAADNGPKATVARFHAALLEVMRNGEELGYAGRRDRLQPLVRALFDLPYIAKAMLSRHWPSLDAKQRADIVGAFGRLAVASLAANFDSYDGEQFIVKDNRTLKGGRARVRSALQDSDGDITPLDYVLHRTGRGWRITNVWFDGVSERGIRSAEFSSIIAKEGFAALMRKLDATIAGFARNESG